MNTLFYPAVPAADVPAVPGLRYLPAHVDEADERALVAAIDGMPWNTAWKRRRQPYGAGYGGGSDSPPIPEWGRRLADRLFADGVTDRLLRRDVLTILPERRGRATTDLTSS